jgi:hypothetical protein
MICRLQIVGFSLDRKFNCAELIPLTIRSLAAGDDIHVSVHNISVHESELSESDQHPEPSKTS